MLTTEPSPPNASLGNDDPARVENGLGIKFGEVRPLYVGNGFGMSAFHASGSQM